MLPAITSRKHLYSNYDDSAMGRSDDEQMGPGGNDSIVDNKRSFDEPQPRFTHQDHHSRNQKHANYRQITKSSSIASLELVDKKIVDESHI